MPKSAPPQKKEPRDYEVPLPLWNLFDFRSDPDPYQNEADPKNTPNDFG